MGAGAGAGAGAGDAAAANVPHRPAAWPVIKFSEVSTTWHYKKSIDDSLRAVGASWLNPFELFNPWYGYALGKYLMESHIGADATAAAAAAAAAGAAATTSPNNTKKIKKQPKSVSLPGPDGPPLRIFELGGGSGTVAADVLDYVRRVAPRIYKQTTYTIVNPRPELLALQLELVRDRRGHGEPGRVVGLVEDFTRSSESATSTTAIVEAAAEEEDVWEEDDCFVLALDAFDNLPRDKVYRDADGVLRAAVVVDGGGDGVPPTEQFVAVAMDAGSAAGGGAAAEAAEAVIARTVAMLDKHNGLDARGRAIPGRQVLSAEAEAIVPREVTRADILSRLQGLLMLDPTDTIARATGSSASGTAAVVAGGKPVFVPTGAVQLFTSLRSRLPRHRLVASGFDQLPKSDAALLAREVKECANPPLVSNAEDGDLSSYVVGAGGAVGVAAAAAAAVVADDDVAFVVVVSEVGEKESKETKKENEKGSRSRVQSR